MAKSKNSQEPLEKQLFKAADKLRNNIDAAEYKHVVLGLIFLKYISDSFTELYDSIVEQGYDAEDRDEYLAENVFYVPKDARWDYLLAHAKSPDIGLLLDKAMDVIESENAQLKGVLPKVYAKENLDKTALGSLLDIVGNISLGDSASKNADVLGHVFEYFLGEFALSEGQKGGQFYTPKSVVTLLVEMLEPYKGRVMDPCCGSGGMFVQSEKFVEGHQGKITDISIYGQESNQTTWRLCKMNLSIRGIDSSMVKWNTEGSFLKNELKDVRVDYILANPPFNVSDWSGELLAEDGRWKYGTPPPGNANYAWLQHFLFHLAPQGRAGVVMANSSLTTRNSMEQAIKKQMVENGHVLSIVSLPTQLFMNTGIPACIWILSKTQVSNKILFVDADTLGEEVDNLLVFKDEDIKRIVDVLRAHEDHGNVNIEGFAKSVSIDEVLEKNCFLSPPSFVHNSRLLKHSIKKNIVEEFNRINSDKLDYTVFKLSKVGIEINDKSLLRLPFVIDAVLQKLFDRFITLNDCEQAKFSDIADISIGRTPPRKEKKWFCHKDQGWQWVSIKDMANYGVYTGQSSEHITEEAVSKHNFSPAQKGDIILSFKLTIGRVAIASKPLVTNEAIATIKIKNDIHKYFLYWVLKNYNYDSLGNTSSIGKAVNSTTIKNMLIPLPSLKQLELFNDVASTVFDLAHETSSLEF